MGMMLKCLSLFLQLVSKHQSIGGMSHTTPPSMATTVLKNVKKGISALSERLASTYIHVLDVCRFCNKVCFQYYDVECV